MNTSKIIKGVVGGGRYTVTAPIIKEDYGLYLQIKGIDLPETYEVDFSNDEHSGSSVTMIGNADGVLIPSQFIKSGKDVFAFLYHVGEDYGRTVFKFRIPNKLRPDRTNEEPTPEEQSVIDQTISALNDAVESAQEAQEAIESMSVSATTLSEGSSATVTKTEQDGVVHLEFGIPKGQTGAHGERGAQGAKGDRGEQGIQGERGLQGIQGPKGDTGATGPKGDKGDKGDTGATGAQGIQGAKGDTGADGYSPTVTITPITGGHRITITDADGEHSADVMDGTGNVEDVQINGTSIVSDGVANVPLAGTDDFGVVKVIGESYGIASSVGRLSVSKANDAQVQSGTNNFKPIVPSNQHSAAFYGLAKASGDETQLQSANPVGTYTDDAKEAIQNMLDVPSNDDVVNDVQINGTSIVNNGVANIPLASGNGINAIAGVVKAYDYFGIGVNSDGQLYMQQAGDAHIKSGVFRYRPISPQMQHYSTFYGLAKVAGHDEKDSTRPVGEYTDAAKDKIQTMLGIADLIGNREGATASQAYSVGDVLLHDGKLYKVTASIAQGSAIVPDTNCTQTTIIDLLRGV